MIGPRWVINFKRVTPEKYKTVDAGTSSWKCDYCNASERIADCMDARECSTFDVQNDRTVTYSVKTNVCLVSVPAIAT